MIVLMSKMGVTQQKGGGGFFGGGGGNNALLKSEQALAKLAQENDLCLKINFFVCQPKKSV